MSKNSMTMTKALVFVTIIAVLTMGCQEEEKGERIPPDGTYSVNIEGETGDTLYIEWKASGSVIWQLKDDNSTPIPGRPEHIYGSEMSGEQRIELFQNATYTLVFQNTDDKTVTLELEWDIE